MKLDFTILFVAIVMLLFSSIAIAQLNESDTMQSQFRAALSGTWQKGNVELLAIRGKLELVSNGKKSLVFKSQASSLYQEFGNRKADNDLYSRNFLYYKPRARFYAFSMAFIQTNFRHKIDYRCFAGVGGTCQLIKKANHSLKLSAAIIGEDTKYASNLFNETYYNGSENISLWRATVYIAGVHRIFENKLKLFYNGNWQPAFDKVANNRVQLDFGAEMIVWKRLNFQIEYIFNYEQVVVNQVKKTDRILVFGINYQLKK